MSNVVAFRPRRATFTPYPVTFVAAWDAYPESGRVRSSRRLSLPEWIKCAQEVGEEPLLGAVLRYAREDKEHKREYGAPGFHRWLKGGRWEHWIGPGSIPIERRFPDDHIRAEVIAATSEAFAISYLDQCDVEGTTLIVKTDFAVSKLKEKAALFRSLGFTGMKKGQKS